MKKTLLLFQSSLVLLLISLSMNISYSETFKPIPEEVFDEICDFYDETSFECELVPSMLIWIDLNFDGEMEIIVDGRDILVNQMSGEYSTWLFYKRETKFVLLNHFRGYGIKVLSNKSNGYLDLSQDYKDYYGPKGEDIGWRMNKKIYKFDKTQGGYVLSGEN
ncbi:MAG: hypothetical protein JSW69_06400 [Deltaproteobacteria bacterium]|jgi:hypothetical protein|nr:MAG: hypothetical protein JSW69_06400 [Deltaproteobacteria bacterium]